MRKYAPILLLMIGCNCVKSGFNNTCKLTEANLSRHLDSVVIYALTSSDLVFDNPKGSCNPLYIKLNGKRFVNKDTSSLKVLDSFMFKQIEFNAYSSKSFSLLTEYDEIGESPGFYHVYEIYFSDSSSRFITQIATVHGAYLYVGYNKYGSCNKFIEKFKLINSKFIKF